MKLIAETRLARVTNIFRIDGDTALLMLSIISFSAAISCALLNAAAAAS